MHCPSGWPADALHRTRWLRAGTGNPVPPGGNSGNTNEGIVERNIKSTLCAFEDEKRDGAED